MAKDVSDISRIALGAVTDKDFAGFQMDAARSVIVPDDGIYQEIIALFGTVTVECLFVCQLVSCLIYCLNVKKKKKEKKSLQDTDRTFFR